MLRKYTVQPGDTLISIAEKFYGDPKAFTDIFNANQDVIADPYNLAPGTDLYIPPSATEVDREIHSHNYQFREMGGQPSQPTTNQPGQSQGQNSEQPQRRMGGQGR